MKRDFDKLMEHVKTLHEELLSSKPRKPGHISTEFEHPGVYLFSERGRFLYAGHSKNMRDRIRQHHQPDRRWNAPFAFLLVGEVTDNWDPTYRAQGSRKRLLENKAFLAAFSEQVHRIAKMDVRLVRVDDPLVRALLEIYTSTVLDTPYNEFNTTQVNV